MFILIFFITLFVFVVIKKILNKSKYSSFDIHNSYESMNNLPPTEVKVKITEDEILLNSISDHERRKCVLEYLEFKSQIESKTPTILSTTNHKKLYTFRHNWHFKLRNDLDGNLLINHLRYQSDTCKSRKVDYLYFEISLDFHELTLQETREIFERVIDFCKDHNTEITVIHGYNNGSTLKTFFRNYSKKNVTVSSNDTLNKGRTFFKTGSREWEEFSYNNKNTPENNVNKILTNKLSALNISDDDIYEYLSLKKAYEEIVEEIYDRYLLTNENYELIGSEFKVVERKSNFDFLIFEDLYLSCENMKDYLDSAERHLIPNSTISYPILSRNGPFINYTTGSELDTIDSRTIKSKSNRVYIKKNRLYIENFK